MSDTVFHLPSALAKFAAVLDAQNTELAGKTHDQLLAWELTLPPAVANSEATGDPGPALSALQAYARRVVPIFNYADFKATPGEEADRGKSLRVMGHPGAILVQRGLSPAQEFAIIAHELGHMLVPQIPAEVAKKEAQDRDKGDPDAAKRYQQAGDESVAEIASYCLCEAVGLDSARAHARYLASYRTPGWFVKAMEPMVVRFLSPAFAALGIQVEADPQASIIATLTDIASGPNGAQLLAEELQRAQGKGYDVRDLGGGMLGVTPKPAG